MAGQGPGPPFRRWGFHPLYDLEAALSWARARLAAAKPLRERAK